MRVAERTRTPLHQTRTFAKWAGYAVNTHDNDDLRAVASVRACSHARTDARVLARVLARASARAQSGRGPSLRVPFPVPYSGIPFIFAHAQRERIVSHAHCVRFFA